jgi:hypothetical protein
MTKEERDSRHATYLEERTECLANDNDTFPTFKRWLEKCAYIENLFDKLMEEKKSPT